MSCWTVDPAGDWICGDPEGVRIEAWPVGTVSRWWLRDGSVCIAGGTEPTIERAKAAAENAARAKRDEYARALSAESKLATVPATAALPEPTGEVEQIAAWLSTCELFPNDDGTDVYKRAWNNARHDAARQLRNGNWRKAKP